MKAVVNVDVGRVELREVPVPQPGPEEVRLRVRAVGVCGSDVHQWLGPVSWNVHYPVILGHEFTGTVDALGPGVEGWQIGQRVVSETAARVCGRCIYCRTGQYNVCPERKGFGYGVDGAMAGYVVVRESLLHAVPPGVPDEEAAMAEPASVAFQAVAVKSRIQPGDTVVVIGPGPIGLMALQVARLFSPHPVILVGTPRDEARLEVARNLGADLVFTDPDKAVASVRRSGDGLGAHLVVDAVGVSTTVAMALDVVRPNGQVTKVGWGPQPLDVSLDPLVARAATLQGSFSHTYPVWERVLQLMALGRIQAGPLVRLYPLDEWERAFSAMHRLQVVKSVLIPEEP